jgi:hypothetical protein
MLNWTFRKSEFFDSASFSAATHQRSRVARDSADMGKTSNRSWNIFPNGRVGLHSHQKKGIGYFNGMAFHYCYDGFVTPTLALRQAPTLCATRDAHTPISRARIVFIPGG